MNIEKLIKYEGAHATYYDGYRKISVILCDVKNDFSIGTTCRARDKWTGYLITESGRTPKIFHLKSDIEKGILVIDYSNHKDSLNKEVDLSNRDLLKDNREQLSQFFLNNVEYDGAPFRFDDEQLNAILSEENTLITARAGSGKTRVLIGKLIYLFEQQRLNENNVLALCFNKNARLEIVERLQKKCKVNKELKYENYDIAKNFHAFSKNAFASSGKILKEKTKLIKLIINELRQSDLKFSEEVYRFFKDETLRIDKKQLNIYYKFLRNSQYTTLKGVKVRSRAEKYIADFLFEHGINYVYERSFYPKQISFENARMSQDEIKTVEKFVHEKKETVPDFYLPNFNLIWEHWAVTGKETQEEISHFENTVGNYEEYLKNREWKQKFWSGDWRKRLSNINKYNNAVKIIDKFIQTTHRELNLENRDEVEAELHRILTNCGIVLKKLPDEELYEKVWKNCIDDFTLLIEQFINKLQQNYFDDIYNFIEKAKYIEDERTKTFYRLGYQIYKKYVEVLGGVNNTEPYSEYNYFSLDFNQLIYEAAKRIESGELDNSLKELKWILVDEYQDFSRLFDYLINAILKRNGDIKLFCVGDDWQAINRFAGSDLKYFNAFSTRYMNAKCLNIRTNYRSESHIVQFANSFMNKCDMVGTRPISKILSKGTCEEIDITYIYLGKFNDADNIYLKYLYENEYKRIEKAKYLKVCADIIKENQDGKIMLLNRSNQILGKELDEFNSALKNICSEFMPLESYKENVSVKTVHSAKGEEADVIIVLNVNKGAFPVFNSNNELFEIFGQKPIDSIEDEERLYYVALTRAKHNLYILYEGNNKSSFIISK